MRQLPQQPQTQTQTQPLGMPMTNCYYCCCCCCCCCYCCYCCYCCSWCGTQPPSQNHYPHRNNPTTQPYSPHPLPTFFLPLPPRLATTLTLTLTILHPIISIPNNPRAHDDDDAGWPGRPSDDMSRISEGHNLELWTTNSQAAATIMTNRPTQ